MSFKLQWSVSQFAGITPEDGYPARREYLVAAPRVKGVKDVCITFLKTVIKYAAFKVTYLITTRVKVVQT